MTRSVTILLSSFDGEEWLPDLFASMFSQTFSNWTLRVRDDGSSDGTVDLVRAAARDDSRIELIEDDLGNLGPAGSFMALLATIGPDDDVFAFCDQDDVWLPEKLATSVAALAETPIAAVYTDAEVTDARGQTVAPSAMAERGALGAVPYGHLLVNNAAIGATMLGTAALAERAVALAGDEPVLMHDWWVALVAGHQGTLTALATPTLKWRRHEGTVTGSRPATWRGRAERRRHYVGWSISAARRLAAAPAHDADAARAVAALAELNEGHPSFRGLVRAWRTGGVRAWPLRGQLSLLFSVSVGRTHQ